MKRIVATLVLVAATVAPTFASAMCVRSRDIVGTSSKDGKLLTFKMRDGRTLVNHLRGTCSDLRYEGFAWKLPGNEEICENQQTLSVLRSGQTCQLGKFDVVPEKPVVR